MHRIRDDSGRVSGMSGPSCGPCCPATELGKEPARDRVGSAHSHAIWVCGLAEAPGKLGGMRSPDSA